MFIIIQLILLVDFAHTWNSAWVQRMEETGSKVWAGMLLFFTFLMYGTAVAGIVCLFVYFALAGCKTNKFVISFNLVLCVIASCLAIHPKVQERQPRSGKYCWYGINVIVFILFYFITVCSLEHDLLYEEGSF